MSWPMQRQEEDHALMLLVMLLLCCSDNASRPSRECRMQHASGQLYGRVCLFTNIAAFHCPRSWRAYAPRTSATGRGMAQQQQPPPLQRLAVRAPWLSGSAPTVHSQSRRAIWCCIGAMCTFAPSSSTCIRDEPGLVVPSLRVPLSALSVLQQARVPFSVAHVHGATRAWSHK